MFPRLSRPQVDSDGYEQICADDAGVIVVWLVPDVGVLVEFELVLPLLRILENASCRTKNISEDIYHINFCLVLPKLERCF